MSESFGALLKRRRERVQVTRHVKSPRSGGPRDTTSALSQNELARWAGVDVSYVCLLESGKRRPLRDVVIRLAAAMSCSLVETDELLMAADLLPLSILSLDAERRHALLLILGQTGATLG